VSDPKHLLERVLSDSTGERVLVNDFHWEMGGDINHAATVNTTRQRYFVKWNEPQYAHMFEVEAKGLELLSGACPLKTPQVVGTGSTDECAYLVLEYLAKGFQNAQYWQKLGEGLAVLHLKEHACFGLDHDNYIGKLPQVNSQKSTWADFFINCRLLPQLTLAIENGYVSETFVGQYRLFLDKLPDIVPPSAPSLLHGDLWNGNAMAVTGNKASIFDPAAYCGAREMDLAMTRLFGGFDQRFYEAYDTVNPIPAHFEDLVGVYNLYPLMVHVNLFGSDSGYSRSVSQIIKRYL